MLGLQSESSTDKTQKAVELKSNTAPFRCVHLLMLPQSRQVLVSMMGSQTPRRAGGYFGLSTNQPRNTLTSCISKACWVSIRRPPAPGVLFLFHWVVRPPEDSQRENWPLHSLAARWGSFRCGISRLHILLSTLLFFSFFLSWLLCLRWRLQTLLFSDVCAAAVTVNKRFPLSKHTSGENCWRSDAETDVINQVNASILISRRVSDRVNFKL